jgi:hypothetical protein
MKPGTQTGRNAVAPKIVIFVEGGVVMGARADHQCEVIVFDADEERERGLSESQIEAEHVRLTQGLAPVY